MNKTAKLLLALTLCVATVLSLSVTAFALPRNSDIPDNYTYDKQGLDLHSPLAYRTVTVKGGVALAIGTNFQPADMCVAEDYLYVVDKEGNRVVVLDYNMNLVTVISKILDTEEYEVPELDAKNYAAGKQPDTGEYREDPAIKKADKYAFNHPQGIYVVDKDNIYIADTDNRRIVVCDLEGNAKNVIQSVRVSVLGDYNFRPQKILIDNTGFINIIAYDVNRGLMRINDDGSFDSFYAQPGVRATGVDYIGQFADELKGYTDTEIKEAAHMYISATRDRNGFIYVTAYQTEDNAAVPLQKLNSAGDNVLIKTDSIDPESFGDATTFEFPKMIDVAINDDADIYTLLDVTTARFFTYSASGALLFVGGGMGEQYGRLSSPTCIASWGDRIIVGDTTTKSLTVYEMTDYAKNLALAMQLYKQRNYEESAKCWEIVAKYNSGMSLAFKNLGTVAMITGRDLPDDDPEKLQYFQAALDYYESAKDPDGYSDAYGELKDAQISKYFNLLFGTVIFVAVGLFVLVQVRKISKNKVKGGKKNDDYSKKHRNKDRVEAEYDH